MLETCLLKFTQNKRLKRVLLETGDAHLVEHTGNDSYWGDGGDGSGENKLGQVNLFQIPSLKFYNSFTFSSSLSVLLALFFLSFSIFFL